MALHFDQSEYQARVANAINGLNKAGLDGLLIFAQESMYYLTGYDTFGYCFFQCLYLGADGRMALLTRSADLRQAEHTSNLDDIRIWADKQGATPATQLRDMINDFGAKGSKLGVEYDTHGLTAANGRALEAALAGYCTLEDASKLIQKLRAVKSPAELDYVRRAGELADDAYRAALDEIRPGADEGDILAALQGAIFCGGGDFPANEVIIGSGRDALLCRYKSGRRELDANDQITLEWAGVYRHYHAAMMRTVLIGKPGTRHTYLHQASMDALAACEEIMRPGHTAGDVFEAYAKVMDAAGLEQHRLAACGYSLGARFTPSWMDWPMFYCGNDWVIEENMVFFAHMIVMDSDSGTAMTPGQTYIITKDAPVTVSSASMNLVVK
jgi:Xaa-Pro aminopeptidase